MKFKNFHFPRHRRLTFVMFGRLVTAVVKTRKIEASDLTARMAPILGTPELYFELS